MCIGMATHLDRESTCTVIETNMVILFGAYLAHFSLTNQSREVTCDFDFANGAGDDCGGWSSDGHDSLKSSSSSSSLKPKLREYSNQPLLTLISTMTSIIVLVPMVSVS